ncbi:NERD domain-containing protein [bacterium]|nr:NERD domain-containing protein [bacterium]
MSDAEIITLIIFGFLFFVVASICVHLYNKKKYEETSYFDITKIPYSQIKHDSGHRGEYLIYKELKYLELEGVKFLFNLYIPTYNNKTTEIDVIMIAPQGIFVFESKYYSGWIFGTESQKKWTQSLHIGYGDTQKEHFYNPIMQNEYHIKYLNNIVNKNLKYYSLVVFSNDCEFKSIKRNKNSGTILIHRYELNKVINHLLTNNNQALSQSDIDEIYNILYPYSQVSEETKIQHIANLKFNKL